MSCQANADLLGLYAGGDLDRVEEGRVHQHVSTCEDCAREVEDYRLSLSALKEARRDEPAPAIWPGVSSVVFSHGAERVTFFRVPGWAVCAAAIVVGLSVGLLVNETLLGPSASPVAVERDEDLAAGNTDGAVLDPSRFSGQTADMGGSRSKGSNRWSSMFMDRSLHLQRVQPDRSQDVQRISF